MPFEGPQGQGPFEDFEECVEAMEDEDGVDDPEGLCKTWEEMDNSAHDAMTDDRDDVQHRAYHQPDASHVEYREVDEEEDGTFTVRMPVASTGEVRNEGDDPLTRDELDGMARQINEADVGVFLNHGFDTVISADRFSPTERLGTWEDASVDTDREETDDALLMADARMMDPETLPNISVRDALGAIKEQVKRDIPLSSSIGWREDEDAPGGNDLMEVSIVGIPADPQTSTASADAAVMARAAVEAGADPDRLVEEVRAVVDGSQTEDQQQDMTDESDESADDADDTADAEQDGDERQEEAPEWAERMLELQQQTNDTLDDLAEAVREDDMDDDDDDEDEEDDDQGGEPDESQSIDLGDGEEATVDDIRNLRDAARDADVEVPDNLRTDDDAEGDDSETDRDAEGEAGEDRAPESILS